MRFFTKCLKENGLTYPPSSLYEIVEFSEGRISGQGLKIREEILFFGLEQFSVDVETERLIPERSDVDSRHFRGGQDLAEGPHEGAVDSHQLLVVHTVGFVEDDPVSKGVFVQICVTEDMAECNV